MIVVSFVISGIFTVLGIIFMILKDKACILISGYNTKTKKEREEYDEVRLSKDESKFFFKCAFIYFIGATTALFFNKICLGIAFLVWIIYLFKNIHLNQEKAFDKYKNKV